MKSHFLASAAFAISLIGGATLAADQGTGETAMKGDEMQAGAQMPGSPAETNAMPTQTNPANEPTGSEGRTPGAAWNSGDILAELDSAERALARNRTHAALDATGRAQVALLNAQQLADPGHMADALAALKDAHDSLQRNNKPAAREAIRLAKAEISGQGAPNALDTNSSAPRQLMSAPADNTAMPAEGSKNAPAADEMPPPAR